jgi:hypothetical protein
MKRREGRWRTFKWEAIGGENPVENLDSLESKIRQISSRILRIF